VPVALNSNNHSNDQYKFLPHEDSNPAIYLLFNRNREKNHNMSWCLTDGAVQNIIIMH